MTNPNFQVIHLCKNVAIPFQGYQRFENVWLDHSDYFDKLYPLVN